MHISLAIIGELHGDISARHAHTDILLDVAALKRHLEMVGKLRHPCARASLLVNDACDRLGADVRAATVYVDLSGLARIGGHNAIGVRVEHHGSVLDDKLHGILTVGAIGARLPIVTGVTLVTLNTLVAFQALVSLISFLTLVAFHTLQALLASLAFFTLLTFLTFLSLVALVAF